MKILHLNSLRLFYILFIAFSVSFVACKGGGSIDLIGEWTPKVEMGDDAPEEAKAMIGLIENAMKLNFLKDGKVEFNAMGQTLEGTYKVNKEKNVVEITTEGQTEEFKIVGKTLVGEEEGMKMIFSKK